jgi:2-aminobenzoate-CoA ligase
MNSPLTPTTHADNFTRERLPPADQWPVFLFDRPELQYPERLNCAVELVDANVAQGRGQRPALCGIGKDGLFIWSYAQLAEQVNRIAQVLTQDMGLVSGNRLLLRGGNTPMMAACWLAAVKAGLVAVPTMPLLRSAELQTIIDKAQVSAALCDHALVGELAHCQQPGHEHHCPGLKHVMVFRVPNADADDGSLEARMALKSPHCEGHPTNRDDVCLIAFTSGTTGKPKGTMHFHRDVLAMCDLFPRHVLHMNESDIVVGTPPIAFTFGLGGMLAFALRYGASSVLIEKHTPDSLLRTIHLWRATQCYTAPTFYRQMAALASQYPLDSLRHTVSAGEALPDATRQLWKQATGIEMTDGIGGTEVIHIYISSAGAEVKRGTIGKVVPGYTAQIVDEAMQPVPPGTLGRLAVRGPTGCRYLDDPRQSDYVKDGWNLPGDTFVMDAEGYFSYQARNDDMIVSAGYNIAGPEVESVLLQHPAVAECGVIGVPDDDRGQVVKAYIVLNPSHKASDALTKELQDFVKARIAPYKYPRSIVYTDKMPRTETGKLQRFKLRQIT